MIVVVGRVRTDAERRAELIRMGSQPRDRTLSLDPARRRQLGPAFAPRSFSQVRIDRPAGVTWPSS